MKQGCVTVGSSGQHLLSVMIFRHCVQSLYLCYIFQRPCSVTSEGEGVNE